MAGSLRLAPYDPAWPTRFKAEAARIRAALGGAALAVEHVGSTAVSGLVAKPVVDVAIAVASEVSADACIAPLAGIGYVYRGPYGEDPRRRYYVRDVDGARVAQIHLYVLPAAAWEEKLAFRDALRTDPALAAAYTEEKYRVAELVDWDKGAYSLAKAPFIERVLASLREGGRLGIAPPAAIRIDHRHSQALSSRSADTMAEKKPARKATRKSARGTTAVGKASKGFTAEERAAMRERAQELKAAAGPRAGGVSDESAVLAKIAAMSAPDRAMAERLHAVIGAAAPGLSPKLWYGMPAYAKDGKVVCFFQGAEKFKTRYATLGFSDEAALDDGHMWPTAFALKELTAADEARIGELLKRAMR